MSHIPDHLYYTQDHEWVLVEEGGLATVGITSYAQRELGDIVYIDIDAQSRSISAGHAFGTIEAVKTVSDLLLPLTGTLEEVNPQLESSPEIVNSDPYGEGWMIKLRVDKMEEVSTLLSKGDLMDAQHYRLHIQSASQSEA